MPKTVIFPFFAFIISIWITSCQNQASKEEKKPVMKNTSPYKNDGLKKSYKDGYLYTEVTIKNGKKNGIARKFYKNGRVNTEITYKNGIKVDTSRWFYTNGKIYRVTPYNNKGKIDGLQIKYHKNGLLKARIPYEDGNRKVGLVEKSLYGNDVTNYPSVKYKVIDERKTKKTYLLQLYLSNNSPNVKFYEGKLMDDIFNPDKLKKINTKNGKGTLRFVEKSDYQGRKYVNIVGTYKTKLGNVKILQRTIKLPSSHLKKY
jgi:hypothetical protein